MLDALNPSIALCRSADLKERGRAVPFDVMYQGRSCRAFAIRFNGKPLAYLNRCSHVAMEMDFQPDRFFDATGQWLMCATHGAVYEPQSGACKGGPCRGGLVAITLTESQDVVRWHTAYNLLALNF
jgi:nitrite reductase/ring-hydroxylating ferredoxin subunit